ncbi:surface protein containing fasciclin-like repeats [Halalkaliarchaeum desulfuricum]|uniref:Surface protein containing fasciclin-like repeats n=1 Tax=Halalkaliarchaeum desulfuricum TaxID=2055893 RepID=A0A343TGQ9_9EURY|nr:surface protein containing fasciclin-like repeats [Halalkaliarchaeum desulfuricum]
MAGLGIALTGGVGTAAASGRSGASGDDTIVDVAVADDDFDVLVAAVEEAGLVDVLSGNRQLTVFAPTDEAFGELGVTAENVGEIDFEEEVGASLAEILTYHVTSGRRYSESVVNAPRVEMLNGEDVDVDGTELNDEQAEIVGTDIEASNGVIHVIDGVLLP